MARNVTRPIRTEKVWSRALMPDEPGAKPRFVVALQQREGGARRPELRGKSDLPNDSDFPDFRADFLTQFRFLSVPVASLTAADQDLCVTASESC